MQDDKFLYLCDTTLARADAAGYILAGSQIDVVLRPSGRSNEATGRQHSRGTRQRVLAAESIGSCESGADSPASHSAKLPGAECLGRQPAPPPGERTRSRLKAEARASEPANSRPTVPSLKTATSEATGKKRGSKAPLAVAITFLADRWREEVIRHLRVFGHEKHGPPVSIDADAFRFRVWLRMSKP